MCSPLPSAAKDESAYQMFSRLLQIREATIQQGHITITDEARPDGVRTTKLEAVEMALKVYPGKAQGDLHISASLPAEAAPSSFSLTGTIALSESSSSLAAEEPYSVHPAFQFDGEIETTNLRLREAADFSARAPCPLNCRVAPICRAASAWRPAWPGMTWCSRRSPPTSINWRSPARRTWRDS
ncbi:MAG: hypothetical protein IPM88_19805 [Nitrospira sp.]|nr:hypothetical protein [Nitrospira sp.]